MKTLPSMLFQSVTAIASRIVASTKEERLSTRAGVGYVDYEGLITVVVGGTRRSSCPSTAPRMASLYADKVAPHVSEVQFHLKEGAVGHVPHAPAQPAPAHRVRHAVDVHRRRRRLTKRGPPANAALRREMSRRYPSRKSSTLVGRRAHGTRTRRRRSRRRRWRMALAMNRCAAEPWPFRAGIPPDATPRPRPSRRPRLR